MIEDLISWSEREFSHLPWRTNRTLYSTLVSEIMLQQTTVKTVLNHFDRFMKKFPNVKALASSTEEELIIQWKGLGYYRRARNLHKACKYFESEFDCEIPLQYNDLIKAPGIGEYTANAILAIGANKNEICIDANLERVLSRIHLIKETKGPKLIKRLNQEFKESKIANDINDYGGRAYNEAMMDLGRVYCQSRRADCLICPVNDICKTYLTNTEPLSIPKVQNKEKKRYYDLKLLRVVVIKNDKVLAYKKNKKEWLNGQKEIPTFTLYSEDPSLKQYPNLEFENFELLPMIKTSITKYRIENYVVICSEAEFKKITNISLDSYSYINLDSNSNLSTSSLKSMNLVGM